MLEPAELEPAEKDPDMHPSLPPLAERTLLHVLREGLERHPDKPAISDENLELTYQQLWDRAARVAGGLRALGIGKGDAVLSMLDTSADCFVLLVATTFLGAPLVPINLAWAGVHLEHAIARAGCVAAVVDDHLLDTVRAAGGDRLATLVIRRSQSSAVDGSAEGNSTWHTLLGSEAIEPVEVRPDTIIGIIFTSGTTGKSKGVLTTHAQAYSMCRRSPHPVELGAEARFFVPAPMFHALGLFGGAFAAVITGGSSYIASRFSPTTFWDDVERCGANFTFLIGPMADFILAQPPTPRDGLNRVTHVNVVPRTASAIEFSRRFGVKVTTAYGQSECGTVFADWSGTPDPRSIGRPVQELQVRLVDPEGCDVVDGLPGELLVKPTDVATITPGYVNDPEATAEIWRDGWFHSGDVMRRDDDGAYYFVDRIKDSIRRRGENISSIEVETAVQTHSDVVECAAIGIGDIGEQEVAVVVVRTPTSTLDEAQLLAHLAAQLPYYAVPRYIAFLPDLPRTQTAKVQKSELRKMDLRLWDREEAGIVIARPGRPASR